MEQHSDADPHRTPRARRSVLYVPASNARAMAKAANLPCDTVIFDLEDAIAPAQKTAARAALASWFTDTRPSAGEFVVRINDLSSEWGSDDLRSASTWCPDALLLPKVNGPEDIARAARALDRRSEAAPIRLWAMIETPQAIAGATAIAGAANQPGNGLGRLDCLVAGTNDLAKDTGVALTTGREHLSVWLMQIVLAARIGGLDALDGVYNDFGDEPGFERECAQARAMGFDGKTLIHPGQIAIANRCFGIAEEQVTAARAVIAAFAKPENADRGAVQIEGRMVERLHLQQAERLLARAAAQNRDGEGLS